MEATKNLWRKMTMIFVAAALVFLAGCTPPGPRALLSGDELLRKGKPVKAVEKLTRATELLPGEPRAWNLLGLAYHRSGQPALAVQAYRQALAKDRSNIVAVAHYNLGCLLLEQNNSAGAADEFRSYTLITNSGAGLVKLGTAQWRLRQLEAAEKTFTAALRMEPRNVEALNGLGLIHAQRNQREAAQARFNAALTENPKYAPALLNSAVIAQQSPATKSLAAKRYSEYLAVQPRGSQADSVKLLLRQFENESKPQLQAIATRVNPTNSIPFTNARAATVNTTNQSPQFTAAKSNVLAAVVKTNQSAPPIAKAAPTSPPVTVVSLTNEAPAKVAEGSPAIPLAQATRPNAATEPPRPVEENLSAVTAASNPEEKKPGLLARLNPFGGKPRPASTDVSKSVVLNPAAETTHVREAQPAVPRYGYLSPASPAAGNRSNAERALQRALEVQRTGKTNDAWLQLQSAVAADPAYFEAQYNAALLAFQLGDLKRALAGWETALAIEPDSINARYSFALTLKQANYPRDAANELEKILEAKPEDARAHLALGNLYAQSLQDMAKARAHYQKFLSLDPRNPQASAIRFWLAANP